VTLQHDVITTSDNGDAKSQADRWASRLPGSMCWSACACVMGGRVITLAAAAAAAASVTVKASGVG